MGVLLRCSPDALPAPGAAFLIVTADLRVSAVSEAAEPLFGTEEQVLGRGIGDLLESPLGEDALAKGVARAAMRTSEPSTMPACGGHDGEATAMMVARISTCGPPRAALVAVAPSPFGRR
jgi:PAS domain-containing protein